MSKNKESLTKQDIKRYLKTPSKCPYCGSPDITGKSIDVDGSTATQEVGCDANDCGRSWIDVYTLTGVMETE
mgnify:CR=1 FL=1